MFYVEGVTPVTSGILQGTVLGPLLSLIFINDLLERITSSVKLFADDCLVYRTIHSINDAIQSSGGTCTIWIIGECLADDFKYT